MTPKPIGPNRKTEASVERTHLLMIERRITVVAVTIREAMNRSRSA
jgi:hypothetical protein